MIDNRNGILSFYCCNEYDGLCLGAWCVCGWWYLDVDHFCGMIASYSDLLLEVSRVGKSIVSYIVCSSVVARRSN